MSSSYVIEGESILCLLCGTRSYNPNDVSNHYCGKCHLFHDDMVVEEDPDHNGGKSSTRATTMADFVLKPEYAAAIKWRRRQHCDERGCTHPECSCSFCGGPIGVSEFDPRWDAHDEFCDTCDLCRDQVPIMLFRGEGQATEMAQFHQACFEKIVHFRSSAGALRHG